MTKKQNRNILKNLNLLFWTCLVFSALSLGFVKVVHALTLTVIPPQIEIEAIPGETIVKTLKIRNDSKQTQILKATVKDFVVSDDAGTPVIIEENITDNRWATSSWIQVSPTQIKLKPGELAGVQLIVTTPDDALSGGHYIAVLYSPDQNINGDINQTGSVIDPRTGTLVYIKVPGDIKEDAKVTSFKLPSFQEYGPINILSTITNLSDIHITPIGQISIKSWLGRKIANLQLDPTNIFPYTSRNFENTLEKKWLFGRYQAQLNASYGATGQALVATSYFWVIPWKLMIAVLIVVILIITIIKLLKNKKTKKETPDNTPSQELKNKYKDKK